MADDWETAADEEDVPVPVRDKWEGEDEEEEVEEAWDADPEEVKKKQAEAAAARAAAQERVKQNGPVISERKKKQLAEAEKKQKEKGTEEAENDPKLKAQHKAEMEAQTRSRDARLAAQLLGVDPADVNNDNISATVSGERDDGSDIAGGVGSLSVEEQQSMQKGGQSLDEFSFDDDVSVDKLAALIVKKCVAIPCNAKHSARLLRFLKTLSNGICDPMKVDDVAELKRFITVKHNEVTQKQKTQQKGKKATSTIPGSKKANTVKVGAGTISNSGNRNNYGDELDDYDGDTGDFM